MKRRIKKHDMQLELPNMPRRWWVLTEYHKYHGQIGIADMRTILEKAERPPQP